MIKKIRFVLPCPKPKPEAMWGDWYFARSLADAFARLGVSVCFDFAVRGSLNNALRRFRQRGQVDLVIRGVRPVVPTKNVPYFLWIISHPDAVSHAELSGAAHVFVASRKFADEVSARGISCSYLPQCTDGHVFGPHLQDDACRSDVLFVGNRRSISPRPVVDLALAAQLDLHVWGAGWDGVLAPEIWKGTSIRNDHLGRYYASAEVVLNDHTDKMLSYGFASNRVFDVLACGAPLVTEKMVQLPDVAETYAHQYTDQTFGEAVARARSMPAAARAEASKAVLAHDTFDNRAQTLLDVINA